MKANELRIGNCIYNQLNDKYEKVTTIYYDAIDTDVYFNLQIDLISPIDINKNTLLKIGFKEDKTDWSDFIYSYDDKDMCITIESFDDIIFSITDVDSTQYYNITKIHELQNIIFILTGLELSL